MKHILAFYLIFFSMNTYAAGNQNDLYVGGSYYKKMIALKDLIADVLPPPAYIVEAYLNSLVMIEETENAMSDKKMDTKETQSLEQKIEKLRMLKEGISGSDEIEGYLERIKIWKKDLSDKNHEEKTIKDLITKKAYEPAADFFSVAQNKLVPALRKGNIAEARMIQSELKELYTTHLNAIDKAVPLTRERIKKIENLSLKSAIQDNKIIRGKNYYKIMLLKDLISDILPPPCFIIESQLVNLEMIYAAEKQGQHSPAMATLKGKALELEKNYQTCFQFWSANLEHKNLRQILLEESHGLVIKFFHQQKNVFLPALEKSNIKEAKKILNEKLLPLYLEHREVVSKLIARADDHMIVLESEIAGRITKK